MLRRGIGGAAKSIDIAEIRGSRRLGVELKKLTRP